MKNPVLNNFRYLYGTPKKEKSEFLKFYKKICDYDVYKVTINELAFVVYDSKNEEYYNFERTNNNVKDIDKDLKANIKFYIT